MADVPAPEAAVRFAEQDRSPVEAADRHDLLAAELHHRVQNTLAIVLALARLTARSVGTIGEFQQAFDERIQAMARTNALLLRGRAQAVSVKAAIEVELEPYAGNGERVTLDCEPMAISADAALSLSLIIHELATNAAKYGALAGPSGRLTVTCTRGRGAGGPAGAVLTWRERAPGFEAGPIAGGGSDLIDRLARHLGGGARLEFVGGGFDANVTFGLERPRAVDLVPSSEHG